MGKRTRLFTKAAVVAFTCLGMLSAVFSSFPATADPATEAKGDIYIGYVEPGVWQVRNAAGVPVKTVTVTEAGPVWFTENQELPVGTYTIHLLSTPDDYVSVDDTPVVTVEVIDTEGRLPSGIGQMSAPYWQQVMTEYKGIPSLQFQKAIGQNARWCVGDTSAGCVFWAAVAGMWNEKKAGISVDNLVAMPEFAAYVTEITSSPYYGGVTEPEELARALLISGNTYVWGTLDGYLAFGLPARASYDESDYVTALENYWRYRIGYMGNTVDEEVLAWAIGYYATYGSDDDPDKEEEFARLMGTPTFEDYIAIAEHFMQENNYYSAAITLEAIYAEDWYQDNWQDYDPEVQSLQAVIIDMTNGSLYFTDKSGDGMFSMDDITTDAEKENLFGSLYVGKGDITASKKLEGRALNSGEFSFGLYHKSDITQASGSTSGLTPLATTTNGAPSASDATGSIVFHVSRAKKGSWVPVNGFPDRLEMPVGLTIDFTGRESGEAVWDGEVFSDLAVAEIAGSEPLIMYDDAIVSVDDFDVTPYGLTPISSAHLEKTGGDATFVNYVLQRKGVETTLVHIRKEMNGRDLQDGEFTFQLCGDTECNTVLEEVTNNADGSVPFTKLTIDPSDWSDGLHTLYVREVIPANGADHVRYDVDNPLGAGEAINFSFQVFSTIATVNGQPTLIVEAIGPESPYIFFVNEYEFDPPATMFSSGNLPARVLLVLGFGLLGALVGFAYARRRLAR